MSFSNNSTPVPVIHAIPTVACATNRKRNPLDVSTVVKRPVCTLQNLAIQSMLSRYHDRSNESDSLSVDMHIIMGCIRSKLRPFIPMNQSVLSLAEQMRYTYTYLIRCTGIIEKFHHFYLICESVGGLCLKMSARATVR